LPESHARRAPAPDPYAPPHARQQRINFVQETLMLLEGTAYRWKYRDGSLSIWRMAPEREVVPMPPDAIAFERLHGEKAKQTMQVQRQLANPPPKQPGAA
jgi:hypothetical protein